MNCNTEIRRMRWLAAMLMLVSAMVVPTMAWADGYDTNGFGSDGTYQPAIQVSDTHHSDLNATHNGYYAIENAGQLYWFAQEVNSGSTGINAVLTKDITVNTSVLDASGNLSNNGSGLIRWTTIGNGSTRYTGTFDGNGKTISGLYFNNGNQSYVGLFGWISGGTVKNVGVVDSYINGGHNTGGLCGQNVGTISNCYYIGSVSGDLTVGGLCGNNTSTISNCYSIGSVSGNGTFVGGLCGQNSGTIKHCYYNSKIYTGKAVGYNNGYVEKVEGKTTAQFNGGEVAWLLNEGTADGTQVWYQTLGSDDYPVFDSTHGTVRQCSPCTGVYTNTDDLSADHDYDNGGTCLNCRHSVYEPAILSDGVYQIGNYSQLYWFAQQVNNDNEHYGNAKAVLTADITVNTGVLDESGNLVSNVSGFRSWTPIGNSSSNAYSGTFDGQGHTISGLYFNNPETDNVGLFGISSGTIKNLGVVNSYIKGKDYVGAVCGINNGGGKIENCYNAGYVDGNRHYVGGLCGSNYGKIACSYNKGTVAGAQFVGGVCSINQGGTIDNCYNAGSVSGTGYNIGGVCGSNWANAPGVTSTITNCYNIGNVSGPENVGGVCGKNVTDQGSSSTITNCYYNSQIYSGDAIGDNNGTVEIVEDKTTAQFKSGEVAWLLNGSTSEGSLAWYQNFGGETTDNFPVLDNTHNTVEACYITLPESIPHGSVKVSHLDGEELTPDSENKIFAAKGLNVKIVAIPDENYIVFKITSGEATYYTLYNTLQISKDFSLNAEFIYGFEQNGYKYEIISGESEENKVRVIMATATEGKLVIPVSIENNSTTYKITEIGKDAFVLAEGLKTLYVNSTSPLSIEAGSNPFADIASTATLRVPYGAMDSYKAEDCPWNVFNDIRSFTMDGENNIVDLWRINVNTNNENFGGFTIEQAKGGEVVTVENNAEVPSNAALSLKVTPNVDEEKGTTYVTVSVKNGDTALTKTEGEEDVYAVTVGNEDVNIGIAFALKSFQDDNLKYEMIELEGDKVKVTGKVGSATALTFPESVQSPDDSQITYKVTQIVDNAFANDAAITSVEIPASIVSIGVKAFSGCSKLEDIIFTGTVPPTIGEGAFDGIHTDALITVPALSVDKYKTALGDALASKVIGDKGVITLIHNQGGKINVYVVNGDTETLQTPADGKVLVDWGTQVKIEAVADEGYVFERLKINDESLGNDVNTYTVRIMRYSPSTVSGQGENFGDITAEASFSVKIATSGGGGDESVTIKGSIDTTGGTQTIIVTHCAEGTESATIPEALGASGTTYIPVTSIAAGAFEGCAVLKSVEIPSSITTIGRDAFKGCTSLEKFKIKKTTTAMPSTSATRAAARAAADDVVVPEVDEHAFDDIVDKATLYVPEGWKESFKDDAVWSRFTKIKEYRDDENETVLAELTMTASAGGSLTVGAVTSTNDTQTVKVAEDSNVTVTITPAEGYILGSLLYGGQDVTAQVSGGTLTLTSLKGENTLEAVFGVDTGIGAVYDMSKTVYVRDGRIIVDGAATGEVVIVCDAAGRVLRREVANGEPIELPMAAGKVYIVRIGKRVIKLTM